MEPEVVDDDPLMASPRTPQRPSQEFIQPAAVRTAAEGTTSRVNRDEDKNLRPLVLGSLKILFILVKVGLHVAAGMGSAIPNVLSWPDATPLIATTLTGANVVDNIKGSTSDSKQMDPTLAEAWGIIQEVMAPVKAKGQISEVFQLYQVRYKSEMLSRYLSGTKRRCFWVCQNCRDRWKIFLLLSHFAIFCLLGPTSSSLKASRSPTLYIVLS